MFDFLFFFFWFTKKGIRMEIMRCNGKVSPRKQKKLQDVSQVLFVEFEKVLIKQSCRYCSHTLTFNFQNISVYVPFSGSSITIKNWENINMKRLNTKKKRKKNAKKSMVLISVIIGFWAKRRQQIPSTLTPWWHEDELSPSLVPYQLDRQNFSTLHRHSLPELQSGLPKR